jgi:hypothetical protein
MPTIRWATAEVAPPPDFENSARLMMSRAEADFLRSASLPAALSLLISAWTTTVWAMPAIGFNSRFKLTASPSLTATLETVTPS